MKGLRISLAFLVLCIAVFVCYAQSSKDKKSSIVDDVPGPGALNAIKKAYQMTDICFTPIDSFVANPDKTYYGGKKYQGIVYSSVKELHSFVGIDVSFHTFMTALHNQRSVMYTENVSKPPYHGVNCGAYYGTVCSGLITYALGLNVYQKSYDVGHSDLMQLVSEQSANGIQLADVLWRKGHVALITAIKRDSKTGRVVQVEISQALHRGCYRSWKNSEKSFNEMLRKGKWKIYRYKYLNQNTEYTPLTNFVAVGNEKLTPYKYNDEICTSRGDKACYIVGDEVVLNIASGYKEIEIYKDTKLYRTLKIGKDVDITVSGLPYGDYKARVVNGQKKSDYTYWKVIDVNVKTDRKKGIIHFNSSNSSPVYAEFCSAHGGTRPTSGVFELTETDIKNGYIKVNRYTNKLREKLQNKYVRVHFECDYGRVTNQPINWFE